MGVTSSDPTYRLPRGSVSSKSDLSFLSVGEEAVDVGSNTVYVRVQDTGTPSDDIFAIDAGTLNGLTSSEIIASASGGALGEKTYGGRMDYDSFNGTAASDVIVYTRVFLKKESYDRMQFWSVSSQTGDVAMGVYSDSGGQPDSLLSTTGVTNITTSAGSFEVLTLNSVLDVGSSGQYWLAHLTNGKWRTARSSLDANQNAGGQFHSVLEEARATGNGLPSTATPVIRQAKFPYFALLRQ